MKKILSLILSLVALISLFTFAACSDGVNDSTAALQEKIAALEEEIKELKKQKGDDSAAVLQEKITELEEEIEEQKQNGDVSVLLDELKKLNSALAELQKTTKNLENAVKTNYERIKLTSTNYEKYININLSYGSCIADYIKTDSLGIRSYLLCCIGTITTQKRCECYFENVSIFYDINITGWTSNIIDPSVTLSYNGESSGSFFIQKSAIELTFEFPTSQYYNIGIESINGFVLVPKENI